LVDDTLDRRAVDVVRGLALDAVKKANSGHSGTAMALAPLAHVLWTRVMRHDAEDPSWPDRDRFVLSAGHASMLLYSMLHLHGYPVSMDDIKQFRQWGSITPGHPEAELTVGVEVTTGPLGQGFANGVGMAIAERHLRSRFGAEVCDHRIFAICSDGDLMEGVSHEAASLAGHQGLGRLVYVYDENHISIDGPTEIALSDDVVRRFEAYGWHVQDIGERSEDLDAIEAALRAAVAEEGRPSLVVLRSHIGYPSPKFTDTAHAHGAITDADDIAATKARMGLPVDEAFYVPDDVAELYRAAGRRCGPERAAWEQRLGAWRSQHPDRAEELDLCLAGEGQQGWEAKLPSWTQAGEQVATRVASAKVLEAIFDVVPGLIGGSADLSGNTGVAIPGGVLASKDEPAGRLLPFGVREHAMGSSAVGMARHGGVMPFVSTFLVFSDYMRPAVRLAALSDAHVAFVWSHDSIGVGEDGPTHQPVEHVASLRAIPGLRVIRPADANEVAGAWRVHVDSQGPSAIILSRQNLPVLAGTAERALEGVAKGAYVLVDDPDPEIVLLATGSEVSLCVDAAARLRDEGVAVRVVSMPCVELFDALDLDEQEDILPDDLPTLAVEAGATVGWDRFADDCVGLDRFGASAPGAVAMANLGFTVEAVVEAALALLDEDDLDDDLDLED
jgi:transketolase